MLQTLWRKSGAFLDSFAEPGRNMSGVAWAWWAALVFCIPCRLFYIYTLNQFYHFGAPPADSGLFAMLLWRKDWTLWNPPFRGHYSYFGVHFSPILLPLTYLSHLLYTHPPEFYAGWTSSLFASLGLALFLSFRFFLFPKSHWHMALLALAGMALSFNALVINDIWMPHFEYAMPLGIFLFLLFYRMRRWGLAGVAFLCTLAVREDGGFHLAAALGLLALLEAWQKRALAPVRRELALCALAVAYSCFAVWMVQSIVGRTGARSTFSIIYSGIPFYDHLTLDLMIDRIWPFVHQHSALLVGILITCLCAWRRRDAYLPLAAAAYIPWLLFNYTAYNINTGYLHIYYAFPFVLVFCWPLVAALWRYGAPLPMQALRSAFRLQLLLLLVGVTICKGGVPGILPLHIVGSYLIQWGAQNRHIVHDFNARFNAGMGNFGNVFLDYPVVSMLGQKYGKTVVRWYDQQGPGTDTVLYMNYRATLPGGRIRHIIEENNLTYKYCLAGTTLCLYSNRSPEQLHPDALNLTWFK